MDNANMNWTPDALKWAEASQVDFDLIREEAEQLAHKRFTNVDRGVLQTIIGARDSKGIRWRRIDGEEHGSGI